MDKYDILFAMDLIKNKIKDFRLDRKDLIMRYNREKLDWLRRSYYALRARKVSEYKKYKEFDSSTLEPVVSKRFTLGRNLKF